MSSEDKAYWYEKEARQALLQEEPECKDLMCYFHGGSGIGCMTSGRCVYEPDEYELELMNRQHG